jgi:transcriptional regulator with XRE-family HTH domain
LPPVNDEGSLIGHNWRMARAHRLYLGEWLIALGVTAAECSKETGIGTPYLSLLIAGKRDNPSPAYRDKIADFLGIDWRQLYDPPPDREFLTKLRRLDSKTLNRLK